VYRTFRLNDQDATRNKSMVLGNTSGKTEKSIYQQCWMDILSLVKIRKIKHKMENVEVIGEVVHFRDDPRRTMKHAIAILSDETGRIGMDLWRDQVAQVKVGDTIHLFYAFTHTRKGRVLLNTWEEKIKKEISLEMNSMRKLMPNWIKNTMPKGKKNSKS